ncbi:hypothetical protein QVD17_15889 [Tagetes erecta]|uniref:Uncharacterized protein n=1 Tax=Tagetes erecta TaxID=13708 RepID=A0AAD8KU43_TARER|nr:hypothetical protein QVD17_15889 [Tagetes erecta]
MSVILTLTHTILIIKHTLQHTTLQLRIKFNTLPNQLTPSYTPNPNIVNNKKNPIPKQNQTHKQRSTTYSPTKSKPSTIRFFPSVLPISHVWPCTLLTIRSYHRVGFEGY